MSLFEYVTVMVSVVLALGVAQLLSGVGRALVSDATTYWLHSVWLAFLALLHLQIWWSLWDIRSHPPDTVAAFLFTITGPAIVYLNTYVLLGGTFPSDAEEHYFRVRRPFFALAIAGTVFQLLNPVVQGYPVPALFRVGAIASVAVAVLGFVSSDRRVHSVIGPFFLLTLLWSLVIRFEAGAFTP